MSDPFFCQAPMTVNPVVYGAISWFDVQSICVVKH